MSGAAAAHVGHHRGWLRCAGGHDGRRAEGRRARPGRLRRCGHADRLHLRLPRPTRRRARALFAVGRRRSERTRASGIGRLLKYAQRDFAPRGWAWRRWSGRSIHCRRATPASTSACSGATSRIYEVDLYGSRTDALNAGLATDRLLAEWPTFAEPTPSATTGQMPRTWSRRTPHGVPNVVRARRARIARASRFRRTWRASSAHPSWPRPGSTHVRAAFQARLRRRLRRRRLQRAPIPNDRGIC